MCGRQVVHRHTTHSPPVSGTTSLVITTNHLPGNSKEEGEAGRHGSSLAWGIRHKKWGWAWEGRHVAWYLGVAGRHHWFQGIVCLSWGWGHGRQGRQGMWAGVWGQWAQAGIR